MEPSSRLPPLGRSLSAEAADDVAATAGPKVTVRRFVLEAGVALDAAALQAAVAPYLNRPVSYEDLLAATRAVALAYRQAGWVVSAELPEQDVSDGEVRITLTNALFGGVTMLGGEALGLRLQNRVWQLRQWCGYRLQWCDPCGRIDRQYVQWRHSF